MKTVWSFEDYEPPVLNESMLRRERTRRRMHRQAVLLTLAGLLFQVAALLLGWSALEWYPWITALCAGYLVLAAVAWLAVGVWLRKQRGRLGRARQRETV